MEDAEGKNCNAQWKMAASVESINSWTPQRGIILLIPWRLAKKKKKNQTKFCDQNKKFFTSHSSMETPEGLTNT